MSEDLDIKLEKISDKIKYSQRKEFCNLFLDAINNSEKFQIKEKPKYNDERKFQKYIIQYPKSIQSSSLRPEILLEFVEKELYQPTKKYSISSMYAEAIKDEPEIDSFSCVNLESIIAEKMLSMLWRTVASKLKKDIPDDDRLIRHIYDVSLVLSNKESKINFIEVKNIFKEAVKSDSIRYKSKFSEFNKNPYKILDEGLQLIKNDPLYRDRYEKFVGPLVYNKNTLKWEHALNTFEILYSKIILEPYTEIPAHEKW